MAAKWKAQQRKQRWQHSAVLLPPCVSSLMEQECEDDHVADFFGVLRQWSALGNTYDQVAGAKRLVGALEAAAGVETGEFARALAVYVEILFQEGSKPVHRTMLSALAQMKVFDGLVEDAFDRCCTDYGLGGCKERRFALVGIGLSLANLPKPGRLKNVVHRCAHLIALSATFDVQDVLRRAREGENPTPALMEDCQDAMSTVYYMLQNAPEKFGSSEENVYSQVVLTSLDVLQTTLMSRDCVVAAGVCFCATAQMSSLPWNMSLMLAETLFPQVDSHFRAIRQAENQREVGKLESVIHTFRGTSLCAEASKLTDFGRLCVLRGLLTAVPREVLNCCLFKHPADGEDMVVWTLLYDGILPALCEAAESSFDSHFKFHAMTALQICLQQIKASILAKVTTSAIDEIREACRKKGMSCGHFQPFPSTMTTRIMQIIWNNWEDPLNQTVRQVQMVFDLLADLQSLPYIQGQSKTHEDTKSFLHHIANDLLAVGGHRKGRYVPLGTLASRIGAQTLLDMSPDLLFQTVYAMSDDGVCCAASTFLKLFLERLRDECWASRGVSEGSSCFRQLWVPPMLAGLVAGNSRLRVNLHTYALPIGLEIDSDSLLQMLGFVLQGSTFHEVPAGEELRGAAGMPDVLTQNQRVASFVSLIRVARSLALMENEINTADDAAELAILVKGTIIYAPVALLELALTHLEESLRVDAAELICLNPKTAVMPSPLELHLMKLAMPLNMRCSSTAFRMKWTSLLRKFFNRVRVSTDRQMKIEGLKNGYRNGIATDADQAAQVGKLGSSVVSLSEMQSFMQWLTRLLVSSLYPSAPYERKYMAMEILNVLLDVWQTTEQAKNGFSPYGKELLSAEYTMVLLGAVVDSWDRLRENAFKILIRYPTPLSGLETQAAVSKVLTWGKALANSPRVRESDAGALVLRLIFRKYVCEMGWNVTLHPAVQVVDVHAAGKNEIVQYMESLNDWLEAGVVEGEKNLLKACKQSLVHGVLLTFRYTVSDLDWISGAVRANVGGLRRSLERLFKLLLKVTSLALWVVSVDALSLQDKQYGSLEEEASDDEIDGKIEDEESADENNDDAKLLAPREQMVMVGCWLSMKEVSLLLGTIARGAPLPGCSYNARNNNDDFESPEVASGEPFVMLESRQLEEIGQHFLQVLLAMKHNGAIDKTRIGFIALCNRLLLSSDTRLSKMPQVWMQQLMTHTVANGQTLDDLLRRSAGIPASFLALFLSEPDGSPRKLLPRGLTWLIDNIKTFISRFDVSSADHIAAPDGTITFTDDSVVPVVHAFNTLRVTFNDTYLATDTSGFCAEGLILAIRAFASRYWQVRNSASLAFTALLHRTLGFLNAHTQITARRAITGFEFFNRYPALHPFLLRELESATLQLERGDRNSVTESRLHPSLAPVLIILSRLRPSIVNTRTDDWLSPSAFMPSVMRCATQSNLKVRVLASRALAPLVTVEKLLDVLLELAGSLPFGKMSLSYNAIHGVLLQMSSLLKSNCMDLPQQEQQAQITIEVFNKINGCIWLGSTMLCPCSIVVAAFLMVLEQLLELAYHSHQQDLRVRGTMQQIQSIILKLCAEGIGYINTNERLWDSTRVDSRRTAAQIYFKTILREWHSYNLEKNCQFYRTFDEARYVLLSAEDKETLDFHATLRESLADSMYEVRLTTLKVMKTFSDSRIAPSPAFINSDGKWLHGLLAERLYGERHPRCVKRILEVFLTWDLLAIETEDSDTSLKLWTTLLEIYSSSKVSKTREFAVRCLGSCVQHLIVSMRKSLMQSRVSEQPTWQVFSEVFSTWDRLIKQHSVASEPVTLRRAVCSAIIASKCLEDARWLKEQRDQITTEQEGDRLAKLEWYSKIVLSVWSSSINLLEDEDLQLRQQLALAIQDVMAPNSKAAVPAQVERVLEASFAFLKTQYENCDFYFDFLASWVLGESRFGEVQNADLVRKLFDKELDNHHEEQLLLVQLCCSHIWTYVTSQAGCELKKEFIGRWQSRFLCQAVGCASWCLELQQTTEWVGGITNHQDIFKHFYRTLLGLLVLATAQRSDTCLDDLENGLLKLAALKEVPLSPMISNLLFRLMHDFEQETGRSLGSDSFRAAIGDSFCENFEPLFLLK